VGYADAHHSDYSFARRRGSNQQLFDIEGWTHGHQCCDGGYPLYTISLFDHLFLSVTFLGGHSECSTGCEEGDEDVKSGWKPPPRIPIPRNARFDEVVQEHQEKCRCYGVERESKRF